MSASAIATGRLGLPPKVVRIAACSLPTYGENLQGFGLVLHADVRVLHRHVRKSVVRKGDATAPGFPEAVRM